MGHSRFCPRQDVEPTAVPSTTAVTQSRGRKPTDYDIETLVTGHVPLLTAATTILTESRRTRQQRHPAAPADRRLHSVRPVRYAAAAAASLWL